MLGPAAGAWVRNLSWAGNSGNQSLTMELGTWTLTRDEVGASLSAVYPSC